MRILITGSEGFVAQHLVHRLLAAGHDIIGVDNMDPRVHGKNAHPKDQGYEVLPISYDSLSYPVLRDIEVIVHLAAQVGVANSMVEPVRYMHHNSYATANFLDDVGYACKNLQKILVASSMSVYGDPLTENTITENHPIRPASPYGLSKYDQEQLVRMYGETHDVTTVGMRFFNVYGPGQALHNPYTGVIANFANWLLKDEAPTIYEDGLQTRDFIYVEDLAERIEQCINYEWEQSRIINMCSGQATTILEMAETLADVLGKSHIKPTITGEHRPGDIRHCVGNGSLLYACLWDYRHFIWRTIAEGLEDYAVELLEEARIV